MSEKVVENSRENIFLAKMELMLSYFDNLDDVIGEISEMIKEQPDNQRQVDLLLSDYLHRLEHDDLSDDEILNIGKQIHKHRLVRKDENCVNQLINVYNDNKDKIFYCPKTNRDNFRQAIKDCRDTLHLEYRYRILKEEDINNLKGNEKKLKTNDDSIKSKLIWMFSKNMKNKDISKQLGLSQSNVSHLKRQLGFETRKYNSKKGE